MQAVHESLERSEGSKVGRKGPQEDVATIVDETEFGELEMLSSGELDFGIDGEKTIGERKMVAAREVRHLELLYLFDHFERKVNSVFKKPVR